MKSMEIICDWDVKSTWEIVYVQYRKNDKSDVNVYGDVERERTREQGKNIQVSDDMLTIEKRFMYISTIEININGNEKPNRK